MSENPLRIRIRNGVVYAKFRHCRILDGQQTQGASEQLLYVAKKFTCSGILLNLAGVEHLSSSSLGKLINLYKQLHFCGVRLCLVNVIPQIFEIFTITKLDRFFDIRDGDDEFDNFDDDEDEDFDEGQAGTPSRLIPPKPSGGDAVILPFPPPEPD